MKKIISLILVLAAVFSVCAVTATAAKSEEFVSEVALIYEDSVTDAKKAIEGTDWKLFEHDLNKNADAIVDDGVYLIYKTTTNVEEAITDLRVMDMYGGYNTSDYSAQLEKLRASYMQIVANMRIAMDEFKKLYNAGDEMAKIAYRQMNYYKDVGETNLLMGDFVIGNPTDDQLLTVMMEGNAYVFTNILALLAIGLSGSGDDTFATRIAEEYGKKGTHSKEDYHEDSVTLSKQFKELKSLLLRYDALKEEHNLEDEDITEEEYQFLVECGITAMALEKINYGSGTLSDFILAGAWEHDLCELYPIAAAFTKGQRALASIGCFNILLQYGSSSKPIDELYATIEEIEADMKDENGNVETFDVYAGVDRSVFEGVFAFTDAATRQQALTGVNWETRYMDNIEEYVPVKAISIMFATGFVLATIKAVSMKFALIVLLPIIKANIAIISSIAGVWTDLIIFLFGDSQSYAYSIGFSGLPYLGVGLMLIAIGITVVTFLHGYFNPHYTPIPNNMVDVREGTVGDKYIKYTAAKVYNDKDGRNADFNAYEGKEWIALYYTKDATAGNCLTPNFTFSDNNATVARRHQGVSMFGETKAFDLNSHVFNETAKGAYVTVRYSNTKKAAASVPTVVGSMISDGAIHAICSFGGLLVGVGATLAIGAAIKKKKAGALEETEELS